MSEWKPGAAAQRTRNQMQNSEKRHALQILEATEGGTRRHLRDLTLRLLARGWRVTLAVSCGRDPDFAERDIPLFRSAGADVRIVPMTRGISPLHDIKSFRALLSLMREVRPGVVHAHSSKAGFLGRAAAHFARIPALYTPHGFAFEMDVKTARCFFYRQLERLAAKWTAGLVAVCDSEARAARGLSPTLKIATIHNGINAPSCAAEKAAAQPKRYDAVFIGRLCRQKAPEVFLAACERLLEKRRAAKFAVMTAWNPQEAVITIPDSLRDSLDVLPGGASDATERLLRSARLIAMPSRWEGFPYLILEAMAAGTPIVASDVGGVSEAARDEIEALLVPPDNPAALAESMGRILSDSALASRLATNATGRIKSFTIDKMVDGIASAYSEAIKKRD